jgi:hypothetical protein
MRRHSGPPSWPSRRHAHARAPMKSYAPSRSREPPHACAPTWEAKAEPLAPFSLHRAPHRPSCRAAVAFATRDAEGTREQGEKVRSLGLSVCHHLWRGLVRSYVTAGRVSLVFFLSSICAYPSTAMAELPCTTRQGVNAPIFKPFCFACFTRVRARHPDAPMRPRPRERLCRAGNFSTPRRRAASSRCSAPMPGQRPLFSLLWWV